MKLIERIEAVRGTDYWTHHGDWVTACTLARDAAASPQESQYWDHQLATLSALSRTYNTVPEFEPQCAAQRQGAVPDNPSPAPAPSMAENFKKEHEARVESVKNGPLVGPHGAIPEGYTLVKTTELHGLAWTVLSPSVEAVILKRGPESYGATFHVANRILAAVRGNS